ncbi:MAG: sugar phosphate nucleotidyltransferase [Bdellovibrionota bacterium]
MEHSISEVQNVDFLAVASIHEAISLCESKKGMEFFPILDNQRKIKNIYLAHQQTPVLKKQNSVVIMAGGLGSRLGEITKNCPKPLLKIGERPLLHQILMRFKMHGFENFYLSINHMADKIKEYFQDGDDLGINITYLEEPKKLGTSGSLFYLKDQIFEPFLVTNGDILTTIDYSTLLELHIENKADTTVACREESIHFPFGVVESTDGIVKNFVEKPKICKNISAGIYAFSPSVFNELPNEPTHLDMNTFITRLINKNYEVRSFVFEEEWIDIGTPDKLEKAKTMNRLKP